MITNIKQISKTGQTTSYRTGDDGTYQAGMPISTAQRFSDNLDGTISDLSCNPPLMSVKQPELIIPGAVGVHSTNQVQRVIGSWATGVSYVAADLVYDAVGAKYYVCAISHTSGLVDFATDLAAHPTYWRETVWATINTKSVTSWTKGTTTVLTVGANHNIFIGALVNISGVTYNTGTASAVNGVRVTTAVARGVGIITVAVNTAGEGTPDASAGTVLAATPALMSWNNATDNCEGLTYAGFSDWRLPNRRELESISDISQISVQIASVFTGAVPTAANGTDNPYYTSNTYAPSTTYSWSITQGNAAISIVAKTTTALARPFRGGITLG